VEIHGRASHPDVPRQLAKTIDARNAFLKELERLKSDKAFLANWFPGAVSYLAQASSDGDIYGELDDRPPFDGKF
jgi:hypothetical protein